MTPRVWSWDKAASERLQRSYMQHPVLLECRKELLGIRAIEHGLDTMGL